MQPFRTETGLLASIPMSNVDTDVIMPKQFLKGVDREGLAHGVFFDLRSRPGEHPDFALNRPELANPKFLVTGPNFGCGSSREHAVWGLMQFGVRAIVGTSFGGIFADNAENNGLLILRCHEPLVANLHRCAEAAPCEITIDLEAQTIRMGGTEFTFAIPAEQKAAVLAGRDHIDRTLDMLGDFDGFEQQYLAARPWLVPG